MSDAECLIFLTIFMIILGIDPGIAITGYGVIVKNQSVLSASERRIKVNPRACGQNPLSYLDCGCIKTSPGVSDGERLKKINIELVRLIKKHKPEVLAVENLFFFKNLKTAIPVSQAKGVILFTAAKQKIPVYEFTPLQIKMAIIGYGRAEKIQIQRMMKVLLDLRELPKPDDAADALAAAVCCANFLKLK